MRPTIARYRIHKDVRPYGGQILEAKSVSDDRITGMVRIGNRAYAPALRVYYASELDLIP